MSPQWVYRGVRRSISFAEEDDLGQRRSSGRFGSVRLWCRCPQVPAGFPTPSLICARRAARPAASSAFMGGSGGVGATTLAAGLAFVAARTQRTMLIDADPRSGGLDLLLGAERTPGWRWPRLATARGHLGDLTGQLPSIDGIDLLSMARGESPPGWS
jgi:Mrp family chromosome partitioning ATPase